MFVTATSMTMLTGTLIFSGWHASIVSRSLREARNNLTHLGIHNALTNLPNRILLAERMEA